MYTVAAGVTQSKQALLHNGARQDHCCGLLQLHAGCRALAQSPRHLSPNASCSQSVRGVYSTMVLRICMVLCLHCQLHTSFQACIKESVLEIVCKLIPIPARDNLFKAYRDGKEEFKGRTWLNCEALRECVTMFQTRLIYSCPRLRYYIFQLTGRDSIINFIKMFCVFCCDETKKIES